MPAIADTENGGVAATPISLGFGDLHASPGDHIGHFYQTFAECKEILIPFLCEGLKAGDKCVYFLEPGARLLDVRKELMAASVDVDGVMASGQLILDEGTGDPAAMQSTLAEALAEIPDQYPLLRWGGDMTWSLGKMPTTEALMEWETHCNVIESPPALFLCQYDLTAFAGTVVMDALKTHPICVISDIIHQNPYYEDPHTYLDHLRARESVALQRSGS